MHKLFSLLLPVLCGATLFSCSKSQVSSNKQADSIYNNRIQFALEDNFTFTDYYFMLQQTGLADTLAQPGPFTVLAPANSGLASPLWQVGAQYVITQDWAPAYLSALTRYSVLNGVYHMDSLPIGDNQILPAFGGSHIYVSKYVQNGDTLTTINGSLLSGADIASSNGLVEPLSYPINPEQSHTAIDQIRNDPALTMFAAAIQRVHADSLLAGTGPFTVLAPVNAAFTQAAWQGRGLSTMDSILSVDTSLLGPIVRAHILPGRWFMNDFARLYTQIGDTASIPSLDSTPSAFFYYGTTPAFYSGYHGGTAAEIISGTPYQGDIPAGNGVLQKINAVLAL